MNTSKINTSITTKLRPSQERNAIDVGWLKGFHSFTFNGDEWSQPHGPLRVINEDRVQEGEGFGSHPHKEFEIFSYIVSGELEHRDSMGNMEIMRRGNLQMTSAGTGIRHSEFNRNEEVPVHFIQIWALPNISSLTPSYYTREVSEEAKRDKLAQVVGPIGLEGISEGREIESGPAPIHADLHLFATILSPGSKVSHIFRHHLPGSASSSSSSSSLRKGYIHLIQTSGYNSAKSTGSTILVNGQQTLSEGDGMLISGGVPGEEYEIVNVGDREAEVLVFDLGAGQK